MNASDMTIQEDIAAVHAEARAVFGTVSVRHSGHVYSATAASVEYSDRPGGMGAIQGADGAFRLVVSELHEPKPEPGDPVQVKTEMDSAYQDRRIITARPDQTGATLRVDYGVEHG